MGVGGEVSDLRDFCFFFLGEGTVRSDRVIMHPKFNVDALKQRNVKEFYDYDLALVHLKQPITLSWKAR